MDHLTRIFLSVIFLASATVAWGESTYDVAEFYEVGTPERGTKAIGRHDKVIDVQYFLTPTRVDTGKYIVKVKKIGDNLYQVKDSDLCVETRYCHEWALYGEEVVLIVESNYGFTKGKIIFD